MLQPTAPSSSSKKSRGLTKQVRLTEEELAIILQKADQAGLTFSDYVRRAAFGKEIKEKVPPVIHKYVGSISNNLNQLTRLANAGKLAAVGEGQLQDLVGILLQILR